jgi:hypothetical protein
MISEVMFVCMYSLRCLVWKLPIPFVAVAHPKISMVLREVAWKSLSCLGGGKQLETLPATFPISVIEPSSFLWTYVGCRGLVDLFDLKSTLVTSL